jgi:hypothetical protein
MNSKTDNSLENFSGSKTYNNIFKIVMIILCVIYFGLLSTLSLQKDDSNESDSKYLLMRIQKKIESLAGTVTIEGIKQSNTIKVWMIYIIIGLIIFLTITNLSKSMADPINSAKSFSVGNLYESFTVAFTFSLTVLLTSSIKGTPNYFNSLIAFMLVFCKSQIVRNLNKIKYSNLNNYLVIALFALPTIGSVVEKIYYKKSLSSMFESFGEDMIKNSFVAIINTVLSSMVLNNITRKKKSMSTMVKLFFQFNLYSYMFNLTTSENANIF